MKQVDITIKKEAIGDYANDVIVRYCDYLRKKGIDRNNANNKYVTALNKALEIKNKRMYRINTIEELNTVKKELDDLKEMIV